MIEPAELAITGHAAVRWSQRVASCTPDEARRQIADFLAGAQPSIRPRRWTGLPPGERDLRYWQRVDRPDVVVVVRGDTAVSVLTPDDRFRPPRRNRDRRPSRTRGRWRPS